MEQAADDVRAWELVADTTVKRLLEVAHNDGGVALQVEYHSDPLERHPLRPVFLGVHQDVETGHVVVVRLVVHHDDNGLGERLQCNLLGCFIFDTLNFTEVLPNTFG